LPAQISGHYVSSIEQQEIAKLGSVNCKCYVVLRQVFFYWFKCVWFTSVAFNMCLMHWKYSTGMHANCHCTQFRRHGGLLGAYPPQTKLQAPQIETWNTTNQLRFLSIFTVLSPHAQTQSPPIENLLATVLIVGLPICTNKNGVTTDAGNYSLIIMIYCRHMVHIVATVNNAWAQKMVSHNSLLNRCWHMITRMGKITFLTSPQL